MSKNTFYPVILVSLIISFGLTLITGIFFADSIYSMDTNTYIEPAKSIIKNFTFDTNDYSGEPMFLRTPGYSVFISLIYLFGQNDILIVYFQYILFLHWP